MRGSVSVCLFKGRQIEKTCINFFEESGLIATLSFQITCFIKPEKAKYCDSF